MLSLIPPSTLTYVRTAPPSRATRLTVPTVYTVQTDGPTIARPGSMLSRGSGMPSARHSCSTILVISVASCAGSLGSSWVVYAMPNPPPRSISGSVTPSSSLMRAWSASTRRAATSKPALSKIWLPMWEWRPRRVSPSAASTCSTARHASPLVIEKPNFWSSWAVAMYSWVCASTPAVTRIITF